MPSTISDFYLTFTKRSCVALLFLYKDTKNKKIKTYPINVQWHMAIRISFSYG